MRKPNKVKPFDPMSIFSKEEIELESLRIAIELSEPSIIDAINNHEKYERDLKKWGEMIDEYKQKVNDYAKIKQANNL